MKIEIEVKNGEIFVNSDKIDYIGRALIRVKQSKDFSKARATVIYRELLKSIELIQNSSTKNIEIGD